MLELTSLLKHDASFLLGGVLGLMRLEFLFLSRTYTLESIFTNLLIEGAQEELSFRTMVCDLRTRFPMLQIVLLNSRAWCCSGHCYENAATRGLPAIHMQPVVKVLFSDCSASTDANSV